MPSFSPRRLLGAALKGSLAATVLALALPAHAAFPPISDAERQLTEVDGHPEATAVVLLRRGKLDFMRPGRDAASTLEIHMRIKILSEEGLDQGELEIPHSRFLRLRDLKARTVRPDGTAVPVPEDSIFRETTSRSRKVFVTKLAFPAVEVGAILDYRYTLRWESLIFLEPWLFDSHLPTVRSEVVFNVPSNIVATSWQQRLSKQEIQSDLRQTNDLRTLHLWMDNLPPVPDETASFPRSALSNRVMIVPRTIHFGRDSAPILESWKFVVDLYEEEYDPFRKKSKNTRKKAAEIAAGAASTRAKIDAVTAWVRDEIRSTGTYDILPVADKRTADKALEEGAASHPEKALLLQAMLRGLNLDPLLVWATSRWESQPDLEVPTPWWFDRVLVAVELDGELLYLDPNDTGLAPGRLRPDLEAMPALLVERHEVVQLPTGDASLNTRRAHVRLDVNDEGQATGDGSLILEGNFAWARLDWRETEDDRNAAWNAWLAERFPGFDVTDVSLEEDRNAQHLRVEWQLTQREEDILGDELTLAASRPIGPGNQPFTLPPERRITPVLMSYPKREEMVLEVTWPEGWSLDVPPAEAAHSSRAGTFESRVTHDPASRTLRYDRTFELLRAAIPAGEPYAALQELYATASKSDAQDLVLILD